MSEKRFLAILGFLLALIGGILVLAGALNLPRSGNLDLSAIAERAVEGILGVAAILGGVYLYRGRMSTGGRAAPGGSWRGGPNGGPPRENRRARGRGPIICHKINARIKNANAWLTRRTIASRRLGSRLPPAPGGRAPLAAFETKPP